MEDVETAQIEAGALVAHRYRLSSLIAAGGMSDVYLAHDESLGRDVALKVFSRAVTHDGDHERRRAEVALLARLVHPGLVTLFDADLDSDPPYLSMELVEGETLAERLRRGRLSDGEARTLAGSVADSLAFVHGQGVVHRDVKPGNILIPSSRTSTAPPAKLADFGIARLVDADRLTTAGSLVGTAAYVSPEQALGRATGPATDVYSLGIVLIEALTGRHPFPGTALESASARLAHAPGLGDPSLRGVRDLVAAMTASEPFDRPSAQQVAERLREPVSTATAPIVVTAPLPAVSATPATTDPAETIPGAARDTDIPDRPADPDEVPTPSHGVRRRVRTAAVAGALIVTALVSGVVATGMLWPSSDRVVPAPSYPAVDGPLGEHLQQLQESVEP